MVKGSEQLIDNQSI